MADAPGHRLGQIVGDVLEGAVEPMLRGIALEFNLYLDRKGSRAARPGKKVSWVDDLGNSHDLDYVLERGGTSDKLGTPAAFIEVAWRRYTKHSRNKAQEIQGALVPLRNRFARARPFVGAILAGDFTAGSLEQLKSNGFGVAHIPTRSMVEAFLSLHIEIGSAEDTPDSVLAEEVKKFESLGATECLLLAEAVRRGGASQLERFGEELRAMLRRRIERIAITALHGQSVEYSGVDDAIRAIQAYTLSAKDLPFRKFEVAVGYSNGDRITAEFIDSLGAIEFLQTFQGPLMIPLTATRAARSEDSGSGSTSSP